MTERPSDLFASASQQPLQPFPHPDADDDDVASGHADAVDRLLMATIEMLFRTRRISRDDVASIFNAAAVTNGYSREPEDVDERNQREIVHWFLTNLRGEMIGRIGAPLRRGGVPWLPEEQGALPPGIRPPDADLQTPQSELP